MTTTVVVALVAVAEFAAVVALALLLRSSRRRVEQLEEQAARPRRPAVRAVDRAVKTVVETAVRVRDRGVGGMLASSLDDLARWASEDRAEISRIAAPDGTVTIVFSDIEDSTALNEQLGDAVWVRLLAAHDRIVRTCVQRHGGHVVKTQGDGFMVAFGDAGDAIRAAVDVQTSLESGQVRRLRRSPIRVRIGMHRGAVVSRDGDYFGRNVALGARVAAHADGGAILVSGDVHDAVAESGEFTFLSRGEIALKGLSGTHPIWAVDRAPH